MQELSKVVSVSHHLRIRLTAMKVKCTVVCDLNDTHNAISTYGGGGDETVNAREN